MKRKLQFIIGFFLISAVSLAQGYDKLLDNTSWKYSWKYHQGPNHQIWWHTVGDTMINAKKYTTIEHTETDYYFIVYTGKKRYLREDTLAKKVYYLDTTFTEHILYDFSLNIGDSISPTSYSQYAPNKLRLDVIDTIQTSWGEKRRLIFDTSNLEAQLIEGVGWVNVGEADFRVFDLNPGFAYHHMWIGCIYKDRIQDWVNPSSNSLSWCPCQSMCPSIGTYDSTYVAKNEICPGDSVYLKGPCDTSFYWSELQTPSIILDTSSAIYVKPQKTTTYLWHGSMKTDTVRIFIPDTPTVNIGPDTSSCLNQPIVLSPILSDSNVTFRWQNGKTTSTILTDSTGHYWLRIKDLLGCYNVRDSMYYTGLSIPNVESLDSIITTYINSPPITLVSGFPTGGTYYGPGVSNGIFTQTTAGLGTHLIDYVIVDSNGCSDTARFKVVVNNPVSIGNDENEFGILIYPNPAKGWLNVSVEMERSENITFELMDNLGALVKRDILNGQGINSIDLSGVNGGLYTVMLSSSKKVFVQKLIVGE